MDVYCGYNEGDGSKRDNTSLCQRYEGRPVAVRQRVELVSDLLLNRLRNLHCTLADATDKNTSISVASVCGDRVGHLNNVVSDID